MTQLATDVVWQKLNDDLRRFIRRRSVDDHAADDLLQETYLRIHRGIGSLQDQDKLTSWVYQIARNVVNDHYRRASREQPLQEEPSTDVKDGASLVERAGEWLGELIRQLPEEYRQPLRYSEIDGLSQKEVARRLGLSYSAAKSRVQRGRTMLKQALERCCVLQFDRRNNLIDCDPKPGNPACGDCG